MVAAVEEALDAGAIGLSTGLIYAPGMHAAAGGGRGAGRGDGPARRALRDPHAQRVATSCSPRSTSRSRRSAPAGPGARLQVSHLKCGSKAVWGRAGEAVARLEAARAEGLDVAADQYPYTAASTTLATVLPPALLALGVDECVAALTDPHIRDLRAQRDRARHLGLGERGRRPRLGRHPDRVCREPPGLGRADRWPSSPTRRHADPSDLAFDALVDDRLDVSIVIDCMSEPDVDAIMAVPWIAVCTDAEGRRPGHPILDAGRPHPRAYGSTARVLGRYVRERGSCRSRRAVAKLTSVPAERLGLRDRGVVRDGAVRRPGRVRSGDRRRRGDVRRPGPLPDRDPARHRQRASRDPRWRRDGRASGPVAAALVTDRGCRGCLAPP